MTTTGETKREEPRADEAARDPGPGARDRAGFDLGGAVDPDNKASSDLPPGGPRSSPGQGGTATGRASGLTDVSGSNSLGNDGPEPGSEAGAGPTDGSRGPR
jgi:hypothetical protein